MINVGYLFIRRSASGNLLSFKSRSTYAMCHLELWYMNVPLISKYRNEVHWIQFGKVQRLCANYNFLPTKTQCRPSSEDQSWLWPFSCNKLLAVFYPISNRDTIWAGMDSSWSKVSIFVDLCRWQDTLYKIWWIIHSSHISRPGGWSWQVSHARNRSYSEKKHPRNMELRKISSPPRNDNAWRLGLIYKRSLSQSLGSFLFCSIHSIRRFWIIYHPIPPPTWNR